MSAAALCTVLLAAGVLHSTSRPAERATALRVEGAGGLPAAGGLLPPPTPAPDHPDAGVADAVSLAELARDARARTSTSTTRPPTATTTTKKPATTTTSRPAPTTTTTRPARATPTTTIPGTPLTTLLEAVVPPPAEVSSAITRSDSGVASWFKAPAGTCAHRTLPKGTSVKVTRRSSGASATCKVADRGPTKETGRLIDLSLDTFEKLAHPDTGLIDVTIEW